jgi:hypothetical protein
VTALVRRFSKATFGARTLLGRARVVARSLDG